WQGGWVRDVNGKIRPRLGSKMGVITKIFANPVVPQIDDYYEPFTFDYEHSHRGPSRLATLPDLPSFSDNQCPV
ncbi:hypothetical protein ACUODJ_60915, partial [Escherichia sp. HC-CC]